MASSAFSSTFAYKAPCLILDALPSFRQGVLHALCGISALPIPGIATLTLEFLMRKTCLAALACAALLAACGGGGSSSSDGSTSDPVQPGIVATAITTPAMSGQRVVSCGNGVKCADVLVQDDGAFPQVVEGSLSVYVGPMKVLTARDTSKPLTSVMSFSSTGDETDPTFVNEMALLYSLDKDADPTNGIQIAPEAHTVMATLPWSSLRFDVPADAFLANPVLQSIVDAINAVVDAPGVSLKVRDPAQVQATLKQLLFSQKWGGSWTLALDNSTSVDLSVAADGTVTVGSTTLTFKLEPTASEAAVQFTSPTLGTFIGHLDADGTGKGTWSKTGAPPSAGFWTAQRAAPASN